MPAIEDQDIDLRERQAQYLDFLDDENDQGIYSDAIKQMVKQQTQRLVINVNDLRKKLPARAKALLEYSVEEIILFQKALKDYVSHHFPSYAEDNLEFRISFEGSFGSKHVTPRNLSANLIGSIIAVEGIVTRCSLVRPKIVRSVHYCPATKKMTDRTYSDLTSLSAFPSTSAYPTKDEDGNLLETEYGLSTYIDHQTLTIQEMPEKAPAGQLPRSLDIIADDDLVDQCKPGDRILVVGPYRCLPNKQGYYTSGTFRTTLLATNISLMSKEVTAEITPEDINKCKRFSMQKNVFDILARSLAPSICGYDYIKKALLCMLLGGLEKVLPNGTRLRGDINILLIGDPSVSKSQLLRYVLHCAPRAVATTGRGSSGVGLTAAVTSDAETGDRRLEAGAMVLADRGVVCIDEFDKMTDIDRTAIHEVMEQGRVTITKAGIQAKLNARCSVLAAANPVHGRYDQYKTPMANIGMQDSLLSRFDLLFIMLDKNDRQADTEISDHIVRIHRYRAQGEQDGQPLPIQSSADFLSTKSTSKLDNDSNDTIIYEKHDPLLHGKRNRKDKLVTMDFMRKYIHIAKAIKPQLSQEAADIIAQEYSKLRTFDLDQNDVARTQPITARTLETLIRLSTAHARSRLSKVIEDFDARAAVEMVQFSHFKKVLEKPRKRRLNQDDEESEASDNEAMEDDAPSGEEPKAKRLTTTIEEAADVYDFTGTQDAQDARDTVAEIKKSEKPAPQFIQVDEARMKLFRQFLFKIFRAEKSSSLTKDLILESFQIESEKEGVLNFTQLEIDSALAQMNEDNQIFLSSNLVILI